MNLDLDAIAARADAATPEPWATDVPALVAEVRKLRTKANATP